MTNKFRWASDNTLVEVPPEAKKTAGTKPGKPEAAEYMNWFMQGVAEAINNPMDSSHPAVIGVQKRALMNLRAYTYSAKQFNLNAAMYVQAADADDGRAKLVAVGEADGTDAFVLESENLPEFSEVSNAKNFDLHALAYDPVQDVLVAVGEADGTDAYLLTSPATVSFTERANPKNFGLNDVIWVDTLGLFIAVGAADGTDAYIITSPDGVTWTERANDSNTALHSITWSEELELLAAIGGSGSGGTDTYLVTSPDGTTWTERVFPVNFSFKHVVWSPAHSAFFASRGTTVDDVMWYSTDGITWQETTGAFGFTAQHEIVVTNAEIFSYASQQGMSSRIYHPDGADPFDLSEWASFGVNVAFGSGGGVSAGTGVGTQGGRFSGGRLIIPMNDDGTYSILLISDRLG